MKISLENNLVTDFDPELTIRKILKSLYSRWESDFTGDFIQMFTELAVSAIYAGLTCSEFHKSPEKVNLGLTLITICPHAVCKSSLPDVHLFIFPVGMN